MSLIECPDCHHVMSADALVCPNCNMPRKPESGKGKTKKCIFCNAGMDFRKKKCPECGMLQNNNSKNSDSMKNKSSSDSGLNLNALISIIVIVILTVLAVFYFWPEEPVPEPKSDLEIYSEDAKYVIDRGSEWNKDRKARKDSLKATREKHWVYQIGDPYSSQEAVLENYEKLLLVPTIKASSVYAFKISRKKYLLCIDNGNSEKMTKSDLQDLKSQIDSITSRICILDLAENCGLKEEITGIDKLTFRRKDVKIPCKMCK